jgi:hypothetical protein
MPDNAVIARIQGLRVSGAADGLSASCSSGVAYLPDNTRLLFAGGSVPLTDPVAGPSWRHLYLGKTTPGAYAALSLSTVAPAAPYMDSARVMTGDDTKRYLASGLVVNNRFRPARHIVTGAYGNQILFGQAASVLQTPYELINVGGTLTVPRTVDLSMAVPTTADTAILQINNLTNGWVYGQNPDVSAASRTTRQFQVAPNNSLVVLAQLSAARTLSVVCSPTNILGLDVVTSLLLSGTYTVEISGYLFSR